MVFLPIQSLQSSPENATFHQISISAFILKIWPVEASDLIIFFDNIYSQCHQNKNIPFKVVKTCSLKECAKKIKFHRNIKRKSFSCSVNFYNVTHHSFIKAFFNFFKTNFQTDKQLRDSKNGKNGIQQTSRLRFGTKKNP